MSQFTTSIDADDFGGLDVHFFHSKTSARNAMVPLLFLYDWRRSFVDVQKCLPFSVREVLMSPEIITWTWLHYFPGPMTGFLMYFENSPSELMKPGSNVLEYLETHTDYSAFPKELAIMQRPWAKTIGNVIFW